MGAFVESGIGAGPEEKAIRIATAKPIPPTAKLLVFLAGVDSDGVALTAWVPEEADLAFIGFFKRGLALLTARVPEEVDVAFIGFFKRGLALLWDREPKGLNLALTGFSFEALALTGFPIEALALTGFSIEALALTGFSFEAHVIILFY